MFEGFDVPLELSSLPDGVFGAIADASIGIALADSSRTIVRANPAFCEFLGYIPEELVGMTIDEFTHPEDRDNTREAFRLLQVGENPVHAYEKRYLRKDGTPVWSLTTVNKLTSQSKEGAPFFIGFIQDITPQKVSEEKLRSTKSLYKALVNNLGVGLSLVDRNHRIKMVNPSLARMFEKAPEDFQGKFCFQVFEGMSEVCRHCSGLKAMESGEPQMAISEGVAPSGKRTRVRIKTFPVFDDRGECEGFVELVEDLSKTLAMETALQESEGRFRALAEAAPIGIYEVDTECLNTYSNPAWERMTGLSAEETLGDGWAAAIHPEDLPAVRKSWEKTIREKSPWQKENRLVHRNGAIRWVQAAAVPVFDSGGNLLRYVGTIVDLTEQKNAMRRLAESQERFRGLYEQSGVGMAMITKDGRIIDANPAFCSFIGFSLQELKRMDVQSLVHPEELSHAEKVLDTIENLDSRVNFERRFRRKDGVTVWGEVTLAWVPGGADDGGMGVGIIQDITKKKEAQARLEYLDYHDELTGLPNRKLVKDRLSHALARARRGGDRVAVLVVGVDRFNQIADTFDHETGKIVLCQIADRLKEVVRQADTLSRLGESKFVILLEEVQSLKTTRKVAQIILRKIAEPIMAGNTPLHLTGSVGLSLYPEDGGDAEHMLTSACGAMNRAKQQGGDLFEYFIPELNVRTRQLLSMEADLRQALQNGEFTLHFQPQIDLRTRVVVGFEALVRWRHPVRGLVSPAEFIPVAEENGVIVSLGEWILRRACLQNMAWQHAGLPKVRMAVNISPRQFRRVDLPVLVRRILAETGHPAEYLELEITESMVMDDVARAIDIMKELSQMGVHLAIDDFGSGYSSLHHLKRFPVERLKVDRNFVKDVLTDVNDAAIASAVVALAKTMHLEVVAEGIETEEQRAFFLEKGCEYCQGFLFSKPLESARAAEYLARYGTEPVLDHQEGQDFRVGRGERNF